MAVYYLDASALVKRYVRETGSSWVASLAGARTGHQVHVAAVTGVELASAITRRRRSGSISVDLATASLEQIRRDLANVYLVVDISSRLIGDAMSLAETHGLRGYDAIQLAAALQVRARCERLAIALTFVSADKELNAAARAEDLAVEDPNAPRQ